MEILYFISAILIILCIGLVGYIRILMKKLVSRENEIEKLRFDAEKAVETKASFLMNMSHEMRTPMNAIIGLAQIAAGKTHDVEMMDIFDQIKTAGDSLISIIDDILEYSSLESGQSVLMPKSNSFITLIRDVERIMAGKASEKQITLDFDIDSEIPSGLMFDDKKLKQVLLGLVGNAIKFTDEGGVVLKVSLEGKTNKLANIKLSISDTGSGIKKEDYIRIFNTFEQSDSTRARKKDGTGLGLSIATGLLSLMGTTLQFDSEVGKGSTFYFSLDLEITDEKSMGSYKRRPTGLDSVAEKSVVVTDSKNFVAPDANILIVDDNRMNMAVACGLLKPFEMNISKAYSGKEAFDLSRTMQFDLIFMDHMMPEMDGIETTHEIRLLPGYNEVPIIALTANTVEGVREMFINEGLNDYVAKPVNISNLIDVLLRWLPEGKINVKTE